MDSLEPTDAKQIDDGDGDSDTNTYVVAVNDGQSLTITATPNPGLPANQLPSGWDLKGGVGTDKLTRTIDLSKAETHTLKATCGISSKTTTIHVVEVESVTADKEAIFVGKEVLFTAALKPISAPVELLKWEWRQKNDDGSWANWSSLFGGGLTKIIMQILPKDYQVKAVYMYCGEELSPIINVEELALTVTDTSTVGQSNTRVANDGETLYMTRSSANAPQTANISIKPTDQSFYEAGEPSWSGQTNGANGDLTVSYTGTGSSQVTATANDKSKNVNISVVQSDKTDYSLIPNFINKVEALMEKLKGETKFGNNKLTATWGLEPSGSIWDVEKPNSPDLTSSYSGSVKYSGGLSGRIVHPTLSGQFPPGWVPGDPYALWEVYAEAALSLAGTITAEYLNEYPEPQTSFNGEGALTGMFKVGVFAFAELAGYEGTGEANADVSASYSISTTGVSPNKKVEGWFSIGAVSLTAQFELIRESDDVVLATANFSETIYDGWVQNPKTLLVDQPQNPSL